MPDLLIKDAELQQLDKLIQEVPTKHGFGIVVFFQQVRALRDKEAQDSVKISKPLSSLKDLTKKGIENEDQKPYEEGDQTEGPSEKLN